ncbi:O-antigen polymerase [Clostridium beijerinckii]|uniref:O-antigen polymerase n=1 Tax=Clostridium beijerinckii TaxID=1520 RepID=UPI0002EBD1EA|nr:O-antigen polymerase [Clostridium beijerinckii]
MIQLIFISLLLIIILNLLISDMDYFNPGVIFNAMFALYAFMCCIVDAITGLQLNNPKTYFIIISGSLMFTFINFFSGFFIKRDTSDFELKAIRINKKIILVSILIELCVVLLMYRYVCDFASVYGVSGTFSEKLSFYDVITKFNSDYELRMPSYVSIGNIFARVLCYIALYILVNNFIAKKKIHWLYAIVVIIYFCGSLMGGRTEALRIVTATIMLWYYFFKKKYGWSKGNMIIIIRVFLLAIAVVVVFSWMRGILGRTTYDPIKVVFGYIGAPIKNLDTFLTTPTKSINGIWGAMTFTKFINWLGMKFEIDSWIYNSDQPFLYFLNFRMGNVYTTYYNFYYDFGFAGCIVLISILAAYYCFTYRKLKKIDLNKSTINLRIIVYSYLFNDLIMLPFSSRFYETIVNINFIRLMIIMNVLVFILNNMKFNKNRIMIKRGKLRV